MSVTLRKMKLKIPGKFEGPTLRAVPVRATLCRWCRDARCTYGSRPDSVSCDTCEGVGETRIPCKNCVDVPRGMYCTTCGGGRTFIVPCANCFGRGVHPCHCQACHSPEESGLYDDLD